MTDEEDRIKQRAYEIWEQEGRPHGEDLKHWLQAFEELGRAEESVKSAKPKASKKLVSKIAEPMTKAVTAKPSTPKIPKAATTH